MTSADIRSSHTRLDSIQVLRAVAALFVLVTHVGMYEVRYISGIDQSRARYVDAESVAEHFLFAYFGQIGASGVDLFFVISGFVMVHVTWGVRRTIRNGIAFMYNRIARVYPMYWLATLFLLVSAVTGFLQLQRPVPYESFFRHLILLPPGGYPFLDVGWSLIYELYFYVAFAFGYYLLRLRTWAFLVLWAALIILVRMLFSPEQWVLSTMSSYYCFEFILGAFVGLYFHHLPKALVIPIFVGAVIALIAVWVIVFLDGDALAFYSLERALVYGALYALLVLAVVNFEVLYGVTFPRVAVVLGDASYSLYLLHLPILAITAWLWYNASLRIWTHEVIGASLVDNITYAVLAAAASIWISVLVSKKVEMPLVRLFRHLRESVVPQSV